MRNVFKTISVILFAAVIIFSGISAYYFFKTKTFLSEASVAEAVVTELESTLSPTKKEIYRPVFQYKDKTGKESSFKSETASRRTPYKIGDKIKVYYLAGKTQEPRVDNFWGIWSTTVIWAVISLWTLIVALVFLIIGSKVRSKKVPDSV